MVDANKDTTPRGHDVNIAMLATCGIVGGVVLIVLIIGLQAWFHHAHNVEYERKVVSQPYVELKSLQAKQLEQLHSYRLIDKDKGVVQIPIDLAIDRYLARRGTRPESLPD